MSETGFKETQAEILEKIQKSCDDDKLIPFIGSGFSVNIDGYPDWKDFLDSLSYEIKIPLNNIFEDPNEATEFYIWHCADKLLNSRRKIYYSGKKSFQQKLLTEFNNRYLVDFADNDRWKQHVMLVQKFSKIYTTNWDKALEITAKNILRGGTKIFSDERDTVRESIEGSQGTSDFELIKFHGDCWYREHDREALCSLMAGETDYFERISIGHKVDNLFLGDLIDGKDFLFIGYSFSDPNIKYTLSQLVKLLAYRETIKSDKRENHFFWFIMDNPEEYNDAKKTFFNNWKKVYPYFLFEDSGQFEYYHELEEKKKNLRKEFGHLLTKPDRERDLEIIKKMKKMKKEQIEPIKTILIDRFEMIGITYGG